MRILQSGAVYVIVQDEAAKDRVPGLVSFKGLNIYKRESL